MVDVYLEKESEREHSVYAGGFFIGSYFIGEGIILESSEGSPISLDILEAAIKYLRDYV